MIALRSVNIPSVVPLMGRAPPFVGFTAAARYGLSLPGELCEQDLQEVVACGHVARVRERRRLPERHFLQGDGVGIGIDDLARDRDGADVEVDLVDVGEDLSVWGSKLRSPL